MHEAILKIQGKDLDPQETTAVNRTQQNSISIVIPNKDRSADLIRCLESIKKQNRRDYEIIVVDDHSRTKDIYEHPLFRELPVRVIDNTGGCGAAAAKNIGANATRGTWIMFLDSDSELLDENVIANVIGIMGQNSQIGAVGGEIELGEKGEYLVPARTLSRRTGEVQRIFLDWRNLSLEVEYLSTCNLTTRKTLFEQLGGFEKCFQTYFEDADFCLRLRKLGNKIITDSRTLVIHHRSRQARRSSRLNFLSARNRILFVIFHGRSRDFFLLPLREAKKLAQAGAYYFWILVGMLWNIARMPSLLRIKKNRDR